MNKTKTLTFMAIFIALSVLLKNFATFFLFGTTKFGLSFIPSAICSAMMGPVLGGIMGGISDVVGYLIKQDGAFFPGFTISATLKGLIYGLFLFKKPKNILNVSLSIVVSVVFIDLALNSVWINMLYGTPIKAIYISKISTLPIYAVLQALIMYLIFKYLDKEITKIIE